MHTYHQLWCIVSRSTPTFHLLKNKSLVSSSLQGGLWEGGEYPLMMEFTEDYPSKPPKCRFINVLFHPNIYPSGKKKKKKKKKQKTKIAEKNGKKKNSGKKRNSNWGNMTNDLLENPNPNSPAQAEPFLLYQQDRDSYEKKVKKQAMEFRPKD
ncbi:SUMO-conjugating enzyme UBC9, putative (UBC9) [Plasmodium ovale wallikeri]|uniref:SUMO-conjugating enzyme UBC9, putative (UBC9) n=1 Tax=Plasmodium ovale wallikeri TaxID=864142 RepID=A0A1A8YQP3_PLAOA|nr:SUMO-conjugating enzyme UBC9, putative (UBC9) [Plasmodium ovale wallikeri]